MIRQSIAVALVTLLLGVAAVAQQTAKPSQKMDQMSMGDMMKGCREHCQATTKSLDQLATTVADAKASNDVNKMRAALDRTEKSLTDMREHMKMCMNMMNMMEKMHGKDMK
ncbi:MAG: hypothetical protein K2Y23_24725 [Cyanobacteria bacterium]|nr:hypothetical protein [Cyanobacteriota bacterium]